MPFALFCARQRDRAIEQNRAAASAAIRKLIRFLETSDSLRKESTIWVRMEDADARDLGNSFMESSISRELQVLSSHTIHHFAMIAMIRFLYSSEALCKTSKCEQEVLRRAA